MKKSPSKRGSRVSRARVADAAIKRRLRGRIVHDAILPRAAAPTRRFRLSMPPPRRAARRSESVVQEAAVDGDAFARDVARRGHAEERDRGRDFLGLADASHRRALQHFVEIVGIGELARGALRADVPGRDRVDANAVVGPFACRLRVSCTRAAFVMPYGEPVRTWMRPDTDAMFTIAALPCSARCGCARRLISNALSTFVETSSCTSSACIRASGA